MEFKIFNKMIDTHAHLNFSEYQDNFDNVMDNIKQNGVKKVIIPGVEPSKFCEIIKFCENYEMIYGALGVHPSEFQTYNEEAEQQILTLADNKNIVAIGEIGLDYHYDIDSKEQQKTIFKKQLDLAQKLNLPVLIHDREAHEDCFNILEDYKLKDVIFHCFSGNKDFAQKCINKGYYIAIGGVVTFKNAKDLKESVRYIPLEKMLLETDSPYLAPAPFRGNLNTPAYLNYIAQKISNIKEIELEEVKAKTTLNAEKIFWI